MEGPIAMQQAVRLTVDTDTYSEIGRRTLALSQNTKALSEKFGPAPPGPTQNQTFKCTESDHRKRERGSYAPFARASYTPKSIKCPRIKLYGKITRRHGPEFRDIFAREDIHLAAAFVRCR